MKTFFDRNPFWARLLFAFVLVLAATLAEGQGAPGLSNYPATVSPASGAPSGNCPGTNSFYINTANGNFYTCPTPGSSYVLAGNSGGATAGDGVVEQASLNGTALQLATAPAHTVLANTTSGVTTPGYTNNPIVNNMAVTGHYNQSAAGNMANKCSMVAGVTCTFSLNAGFTNYLSFVSIDQASVPPATAISANCSLSGTTVTITAGTSNSLTWDCMIVGNPN